MAIGISEKTQVKDKKYKHLVGITWNRKGDFEKIASNMSRIMSKVTGKQVVYNAETMRGSDIKDTVTQILASNGLLEAITKTNA